ncbi:MAG TPA: methyltransferase domain-containing protein [Acidimicrobiia bacterium]|nr:methyltransferase domain-containing protein [Acidimicrobiia bacterium]
MTGPRGADWVVLHEDRRRAESFGREAERYERTRPSYPDALVALLLAEGPGAVLDVGCGTGKAGRLFADRGCAVLGVEPDPLMAATARQFGIDVEVATFEEWDSRGRTFDLVTSGQAWHWIDPTRGPTKAHAVLNPSGRLATFWNIYDHEPTMRAALDAVYGRLAPEFGRNDALALGRDADPRGRAHREAITSSALFESPQHHQFETIRRHTTAEWVDGLPTFSDHARLPPERLAALVDAVGGVIDELGGVITIRYVTHLITARVR